MLLNQEADPTTFVINNKYMWPDNVFWQENLYTQISILDENISYHWAEACMGEDKNKIMSNLDMQYVGHTACTWGSAIEKFPFFSYRKNSLCTGRE